MDNYNNIINQQYGNIVYSNNMMQTNMPMQQNPSENIQHIQNDTRLPPNLMDARGMQIDNTNLTSDSSMRIADNRVQNAYIPSGGNTGYNTNYVANMSTNANDMHMNIPDPKIHESNIHPYEDKYKQLASEPIMTPQVYEPVMQPESNTDVPPEPTVTDINEDFKSNEEKPEDKVDVANEADEADETLPEVEKKDDEREIDEEKSLEEDKDLSSSNADVEMNINVDEKKKDLENNDEKEETLEKNVASDEVKTDDIPSEIPAETDELLHKKDEISESDTKSVADIKPIEEDYNTTCRVCLKTGLSDLIDMCDQDGVLKILDKIMLCASVQITKNDGLPCHICNSCVNKLHIAYDFKITCESSDVELRKRLNIAVPKTVVKTEFVLIECDDQDYDLEVSDSEKPRAKRRYKEESDIDFLSDSQEDSGSDSSYGVNKPKSKRKSKRRTRSVCIM